MREQDRGRLQQLQEQIESREREGQPSLRDPLQRLIDELEGDPALTRVQFTPNFLNAVGYVLERDGFGAAEIYLRDRAARQDVGAQARVVLQSVLPRLQASPQVRSRRALGRSVIKVLPGLQRRSQPHDQRSSSSRGSGGFGADPRGRRA